VRVYNCVYVLVIFDESVRSYPPFLLEELHGALYHCGPIKSFLLQ